MTADTVGGVWSYAINLCAALSPYGIKVHLLTLGKLPDLQQRRQVAALQNVTLHESGFKLEWMENPWKDVFLAREWIHSVYEAVQPDLIHFNNYVFPHAAWNCPVVTVFHSCVLSWWQSVRHESAPSDWNCYRDLVQSAIAGSNAVIFPTQAMLQQAMSVYGRIKNSYVLYNGNEPDRRESVKQPFILTAGRLWDEAKNCRLLVEIADDLEWEIVMAGALAQSQSQMKLPRNVSCPGSLSPDKMKEAMASAAIFAMPAKYEPFGLAVLEAAASGCALALGDIPTLREIWGDAALYFDPFSEHEALLTLKTLMEDGKLREAMGVRAVQRSRRYTVGIMAGKYVSLYRSLLKQTVQLNNYQL